MTTALQDLNLRAFVTQAPPDLLDAWYEALHEAAASVLVYESWRDLWARDTQMWPEGDWLYWLIMAGRGFGKTRTGAEVVKEAVEDKGYRRIALLARTVADCRDVMIEGESGILNLYDPHDPRRPVYVHGRRRLTWTRKDGSQAQAFTYSDDKPAQLRGPQHDFAWADEIATFAHGQESLDNLKLGLRLGTDPRAVFTTTPRPLKFLQDLTRPSVRTHITKGTTYDNLANLAGPYRELISEYEGTAKGNQELLGMLLDEAEGALWKRAWIEAKRVEYPPLDDDGVVESENVIVAVDPSVSAKDTADEVGIIGALTALCVCNGEEDTHGFVFMDRSGQMSPAEWAGESVRAYHDSGAPSVLAEGNQGGELITMAIQTVDAEVPVEIVHATVGKRTRAEPIVARYQHDEKRNGTVHHVTRALRFDEERGGLVPDPARDDPSHLAALEDELCNWEPMTGQASPGRLDAVVWALTHLMVTPTLRIRGL